MTAAPVIMTDPSAAPGCPIAQARFPSPFDTGLEYSAPARGKWTIMHLGLLIPQAHIIFVCAECCLRGVVMSAAELNALDRFSTITIEDRNLLEGDTEQVLIDGVADILKKIPYRPRAVLIYTSCVHEFIGSDLTFTFSRLRDQYPDIDFTDCYMTPVLRNRISPDARNRRQIYTLLRAQPQHDDAITLVGDVRPLGEHSDVYRLLTDGDRRVRSITAAATYAHYQELACSQTALSTVPTAQSALEWLETHLGMVPRSLSCGWTFEQIEDTHRRLQDWFHVPAAPESVKQQAREALRKAQTLIGPCPIAIDYTATARPASLARLLLSEHFCVTHLYTDQFAQADHDDVLWLQTHAPELLVCPTVHPKMVFYRQHQNVAAPTARPHVLAIGQKAAYFARTDHFVNCVEDDGLDGFYGIIELMRRLTDAYTRAQSAEQIIQIKALGCTHGGCL